MASGAVLAPAPFRCPFAGLRVEIPDPCEPSPAPSPFPRAPLTPLCDEADAGPSASTLVRREQLLGTRAGTPRRVRTVRFADAREPMPACLAYQGLRSATLGSTCGTPRARAPLVCFTAHAPARASSLSPPLQPPLEGRRRTVLGARGGSPRRGRSLVSFTSLPERTCQESLHENAAAGPSGARRERQDHHRAAYALAVACAQAASSPASPAARRDLLGSRHGTPRRQKQLGRTSSDMVERDILAR